MIDVLGGKKKKKKIFFFNPLTSVQRAVADARGDAAEVDVLDVVAHVLAAADEQREPGGTRPLGGSPGPSSPSSSTTTPDHPRRLPRPVVAPPSSPSTTSSTTPPTLAGTLVRGLATAQTSLVEGHTVQAAVRGPGGLPLHFHGRVALPGGGLAHVPRGHAARLVAVAAQFTCKTHTQKRLIDCFNRNDYLRTD